MCQQPSCTAKRGSGNRLDLHHIRPERLGGTEDPSNLVTLCEVHHKAVHSEFHAFYPDKYGVLRRMNHRFLKTLSIIRKFARVDDGYDLRPYIHFLTGNTQFRLGQLKTIRAALAGQDVLFITPTGSGKSVCYQLPGLLAHEPTLVISPLKALMKDQVQSLRRKKIPTTYINSDLTFTEKQQRYQFTARNLFSFIFVSPERFYATKDPGISKLLRPYSYLVIDEAHEIEMWGMAFRPSYRKLGEVRRRLGSPPVIALTATASLSTQQYIVQSLELIDPKIIVTGFVRNNIKIYIHKPGTLIAGDNPFTNQKRAVSKYSYLSNLLKLRPDQKVLIFVQTVNHGNELLIKLRADEIAAEFYYGARDSMDKACIQDRYRGVAGPHFNVLIATSAFGMGIDIPDIRIVVHWTPALSLTDFAQQIGRAGRDSKPSEAHLLYEKKDDGLLRFMSGRPMQTTGFKEKHSYEDDDLQKVSEKLNDQVEAMLGLLKVANGTEWQYIREYFGEDRPSFWERRGRQIVDSILTVFSISLVLLFFHLITY